MKLESLADRLGDRKIPIDPALTLALFIRSLPSPEYSHAKDTLMGQESMDRADVLRRVNTQYYALRDGQPNKLPAAEQAYFAGAGGTGQQGKGKGNRNRRSGGGGDGGSGDSGGNGRGNDGGGGGRSADGNGSRKESKRCFRCNWPGHRMKDCTTPVEKFLHRCGICEGFGHKED